MSNHILLAYGFDGKGGGNVLSHEAISDRIRDDQLAWVHLDANLPETRTWLEKEIHYLDPFIIEALLTDETRPRMTQIGQGVLLILRGMNSNENALPEDMVSIRIWVDQHRIISLRRRKLKSISDIEEKLKVGKGPKDAADFLCMLSARIFERMEPVLSGLDDATDEVEEKILEAANVELRESIVSIRKQAIKFRRYLAPQRDAIEQLQVADLEWWTDRHKRYLREVHNHVTRYVEDLDAIRERSQIVKDEIANMLSDRLNRNMYVLSVIAAIFLPLGFLTGLMGINIGGMPGVDNAGAFWTFSGVLIVLVVIQVIVFKRLKWF